MQAVITYLLFLIAGTAIQAQNTIEVSLTEIDNDKGTVKVGLYNEESTFLDKTYKSLSSEISNQKECR